MPCYAAEPSEPRAVLCPFYKSFSSGRPRRRKRKRKRETRHTLLSADYVLCASLKFVFVFFFLLLLAVIIYTVSLLSFFSTCSACSCATVGGAVGTRSDFSERPADETGPDEMLLPAHRSSLSDDQGTERGRGGIDSFAHSDFCALYIVLQLQ